MSTNRGVSWGDILLADILAFPTSKDQKNDFIC